MYLLITKMTSAHTAPNAPTTPQSHTQDKSMQAEGVFCVLFSFPEFISMSLFLVFSLPYCLMARIWLSTQRAKIRFPKPSQSHVWVPTCPHHPPPLAEWQRPFNKVRVSPDVRNQSGERSALLISRKIKRNSGPARPQGSLCTCEHSHDQAPEGAARLSAAVCQFGKVSLEDPEGSLCQIK